MRQINQQVVNFFFNLKQQLYFPNFASLNH
jgi:hypothetical protein